MFICSILFILLSRESDSGTIFSDFGQIWNLHLLSSFGVIHWISKFSGSGLLFDLPLNCSKPPSRDNHCEVPYPRTKYCVIRMGVEPRSCDTDTKRLLALLPSWQRLCVCMKVIIAKCSKIC